MKVCFRKLKTEFDGQNKNEVESSRQEMATVLKFGLFISLQP